MLFFYNRIHDFVICKTEICFYYLIFNWERQEK